MTTAQNLFLISLGSICIYGCAAVDSDVKVPSGAYDSHLLFDTNYCTPDTNLVVTSDPTSAAAVLYARRLNWILPLVEIDDSRFIHPQGSQVKDRDSKDKSPLYLAYDTSRIERGQFEVIFPTDGPSTNIVGGDQARARNDLAARIIYRSDCNFDTFTSRMRTFQRSDALASDTLGLISTATIGSTALVVPPLAAGLAAGKLLAEGTATNIQKDLLNGDTVDVMLKAMAANRDIIKANITAKLYVTQESKKTGLSRYSSYTIFDLLADIRQLNTASSIFGTLETITQTADAQSQAAQTVTATIKTTQQGEKPADVSQNISTNSAPK
jgi:hypothetical protein